MLIETKPGSAASSLMKDSELNTGSGRIDARVIVTLVTIAVLLGWLPRLLWGFWTDEAGTYWMAIAGWRAAIERTVSWPGQSVLYSILESFVARHGLGQEFFLRVPSVAAIAVAAWQLKRIAELIVHPTAGWLAVLPFLCAPETIEFGTSARPYPLALAAALASFRYLLEWQETGGRLILVQYLAVSILTLYLHYLFGFIFVIQGAYLAFCWLRGRKVGWTLPVSAAIVLPCCLLPLLNSLRVTAQTAGAFAGAAKPEWMELLPLCFSRLVLLGSVLGGLMLLASTRNVKWRPVAVRPENVFLVLTWLTVAPVTLFAVSRLTEYSVFSSRYLLFTLPSFFLIIAWGAAGLERQNWRQTLLVGIFGACVLHPAMLMYVFHESPASWRPPLEQIAHDASARTAPVFVTSGLASWGGRNWQEDDPATSSLFAPLTAYPIPNRTIPLPYQFSAKVQNFIRLKQQGELSQEPRLLLLAAADSPLASWMSNYLGQLGYRAETRDFNGYVVVDFRRP
jgi:hypothetical protein